MSATDRFLGLRVLVAEDNWLIGEFLRTILLDMGCAVVGPIPDLAEVMSAIETDNIDAALLDIQLGHANILPAATELASRGIPFIVTTGGGAPAGLHAVLAQAPRLNKPFDSQRLETAMAAAFTSRFARPSAGL